MALFGLLFRYKLKGSEHHETWRKFEETERVFKMLFDLVMFVVHMVTTHDYVPAMDLWGFGEDSPIVGAAMSVSETFGLNAPSFVGGSVQ